MPFGNSTISQELFQINAHYRPFIFSRIFCYNKIILKYLTMTVEMVY